MRKFFIILIKWLLLLAVVTALVFVCWRFYQNREIAGLYTGDQSYLGMVQAHASNTIGRSSRPASLTVYAPLDIMGSQSSPPQLKVYQDDREMWNDFYQGRLEYILVSLDQFALHALSRESQVIFPYAVSQGQDTVVCSSTWDHPTANKSLRVAYVVNTTSTYVAQSLANVLMDSPNPVQLVGVTSYQEAQELLLSGQVEGASLTQPYVGDLESKGYHQVPNWKAPEIIDVCVGRAHHLQRDGNVFPPIYNNLVKSWFSTLEKMQTTPGPIYSIISRASNQNRNAVRTALGSGMKILNAAEASELMNSGSLQAELQQELEFWVMNGAYASPLTAKMPADTSKLVFEGEALQMTANVPSVTRKNSSRPNFANTIEKNTNIDSPEAGANTDDIFSNEIPNGFSLDGDDLDNSVINGAAPDSEQFPDADTAPNASLDSNAGIESSDSIKPNAGIAPDNSTEPNASAKPKVSPHAGAFPNASADPHRIAAPNSAERRRAVRQGSPSHNADTNHRSNTRRIQLNPNHSSEYLDSAEEVL